MVISSTLFNHYEMYLGFSQKTRMIGVPCWTHSFCGSCIHFRGMRGLQIFHDRQGTIKDVPNLNLLLSPGCVRRCSHQKRYCQSQDNSRFKFRFYKFQILTLGFWEDIWTCRFPTTKNALLPVPHPLWQGHPRWIPAGSDLGSPNNSMIR